MSSNIIFTNIRYFIWITEWVELKNNASGHSISPVQPFFQVLLFLIMKQFSHRKTSEGKYRMHLFVSCVNTFKAYLWCTCCVHGTKWMKAPISRNLQSDGEDVTYTFSALGKAKSLCLYMSNSLPRYGILLSKNRKCVLFILGSLAPCTDNQNRYVLD